MAALLMACMSAAYGESTEELDDAAARVQYAYYTADARGLEEVLRVIEGFEVGAEAAMKAYYLAYGRWRLAQILAADAATDRARSGVRTASVRAAQACARHAAAAIAADAQLAEAYAIQAVCEAFSPAAEKTACRGKLLRTALSMAPGNPRVRFIETMCAANPDDADELRKIVAAFETASPRTSGKPDWGHAEVLTLLGDSYLKRGDPIAARDALERALVIAPDYRQAQELLQTAAARPR